MAFYRIGVDVGGTNTDAAILNAAPAALHEQDLHQDRQRGVCASSKTPTTADVTSGICTAIVDVLAKAQIPAHEVRSVAIGTTHFVNAVVEADPHRLSRVAVVRLCGPYTRAVTLPLEILGIFIDKYLVTDSSLGTALLRLSTTTA